MGSKRKHTKDAGQAAYTKLVARKIGARHPAFRDAIGVANIALIIQEAFEHFGVVQRLAARVTDGKPHPSEMFDPYDGYEPNVRAFAEEMDLWTLENVIVRVLTELDRRRRKHLGGYERMYESGRKRKAENKP